MVRDLASQRNLLALPVDRQSARIVAHCLALLFARHGPPLVLKSDNGGPFIAGVVTDLLARQRVAHLRSPVYTPRYNGAVESSGGWLKARTASIAACSALASPSPQPCCPWWTSDHIETARLQANAFGRPWGSRGPTPDQVWDRRPPITRQARAEFQVRLAVCRRVIADSRRASWPRPGVSPQPQPDVAPNNLPVLPAGQRSSVDRAAISRALVELGYLKVRSTSPLSTHSRSQNGKD